MKHDQRVIASHPGSGPGRLFGDTSVMQKIVVGVDGSDASRDALRWAIEHASESDFVRAVYVWQLSRGPRPDVVPVSELQLVRPEADRFINEVVDAVTAGLDGPLPGIERVSYYGHPGRWLVDLSEEVDLLVVGSRGLGGFTGLLLGSVSTYVVHHARCPVVVVPAGPIDAEPVA